MFNRFKAYRQQDNFYTNDDLHFSKRSPSLTLNLYVVTPLFQLIFRTIPTTLTKEVKNKNGAWNIILKLAVLLCANLLKGKQGIAGHLLND